MTIHEFGQDHDEVVVLVHPSVTMWDYFEYVIPLLQEHYHLIVPALPGYDTEIVSNFTSVEEIAEHLASWLISMGKAGGLKILQKAFSTDEYSEEDLQYIVRVLKHMSAKTIWRTFESCNNYAMPKPVASDCGHIEYWYAKAEEIDRKGDITYMKKNLPQTVFQVFEHIGHGGLAVLKPELLAAELTRIMGRKS